MSLKHIQDIIDYESGHLSEDETAEFFQRLINDGTIHSLQGSYQRTAAALIRSGQCAEPHATI